MNTEIVTDKVQDAELQELVITVIEDHTRPAEQVISEQATEHEESDGTATPRFLP